MESSDSEPRMRLVQATLPSLWSNAVPIRNQNVKSKEEKEQLSIDSSPLTEVQPASQDPKKPKEEKEKPSSIPSWLTRGRPTSQSYKEPQEKTNSDRSSKDDAKSSAALANIAKETKALLPDLLKKRPDAPPDGILHKNINPLDQKFCPGFRLPANEGGQPGTQINVVNGDTLDVAIALQSEPSHGAAPKRRIVVLNMANSEHGGGGWLKGALAQEEALCYRSSLSFTLKLRYYPFDDRSAIYSPSVVIFRASLSEGHTILPETNTNPSALPIISVISVAAIRDPLVTDGHPRRYRRKEDRELMKHKMRMVLRIAARHRHRRLVLAALGCGAFHNPPEEVVECWKEVFAEREFTGGWWERVVFAVLSGEGERAGGRRSNFEIFQDGLDGIVV